MEELKATGLVYEVLYGIEFDDIRAPEPVVRRAQAILGGRLYSDPPSDYLQAIETVTASGHAPEVAQRNGEPYDGQAVLAFLTAVGDELRTRLAAAETSD